MMASPVVRRASLPARYGRSPTAGRRESGRPGRYPPAVEQRRLGRSGLRVSRLGLGTMTWGRDTDKHEARDQLEAFVESGGTLIDTAASYGDGQSERVLGDLLQTLVGRAELVVATKAGVSRTTGRRVVDVSRKALLDQLDA